MSKKHFLRQIFWGILVCLLFWKQSIAAQERVIVGVIIHGQEVDVLEVLQVEQEFLLPLADFARITDAKLDVEQDVVRFISPIGTVELSLQELFARDNILYIDQELIQHKLFTSIEFNHEEFAIILDIPWRLHSWRQSRSAHTPEPDIRPPNFSLSTIQEEITYTHYDQSISDEEQDAYTNLFTLGGDFYGGAWRISLEHDFRETTSLREYEYFWSTDNVIVQAGMQQIYLHPLLTGFTWTGVQLGWTNQSFEDVVIAQNAGEVLSRGSSSLKTFRGRARPGYGVQLRIDGEVVAQQIVGFNGEYEFSGIRLAPHQINQVEIYLYDYHNFRVPVDIQTIQLTASELLLPEGQTIFQGGVGGFGNLADAAIAPEQQSSSNWTGFVQWRKGVSPKLTLETAIQKTDETWQAQGGIVTQLTDAFILDAGVAASREKLAYSASLEGVFPRYRLLFNSFQYPKGYFSTSNDISTWTHYAEISYDTHNNLELGLIANTHRSTTHHAKYVRPFAIWQPFFGLSLSLKPMTTGKYRFQSDYALSADTRLSASVHDDLYSANIFRNLSQHTSLSLGVTGDLDEGETRYSAIFNYTGDIKTGTRFRAGVFVERDQIGYLLAADKYILPGIRAEIQYQSHPWDFGEEEHNQQMLLFQISSAFTYTQNRLIPTSGYETFKNRGAIAGKIVRRDAQKSSNDHLSNIAIIINHGERTTKTDMAGNFYVGNLKKGIYTVQLDVENLPIELVPERTEFTVEVGRNTTTKVDFVVRPEYGIAGRITDHTGNALQGTRIELLDAGGNVIKTALTDQFGLYRIDGLPVGTYHLHIAAESLPDPLMASPERKIEIVDDFLFGQDLQLAASEVIK